MPSINFKTKLLTFGVFFFHSIIHGVQLTVLLLPVTAGDDFKGTIHINCGSSSDYTDPVTNKTWIADNYFKGGRKYQNDSLVKVYANRRTRNLYSSCRSGTDFSYSIPVYPDRKIQYNVKLYFYEIVYTKAGLRKMTVSIEDTTVLDDFDILNSRKPLVIKSTDVLVTNDFVNIKIDDGRKPTFRKKRSNFRSILSAISIKAIEPPILLRAGSKNYTDTQGRLWISDSRYASRGLIITEPGPIDISGTDNDELYLTERSGDFTYEIPDIRPGRYSITFYFAETFFFEVDQRVFDIFVESKTAFRGVDIIKLGKGKKNVAITIKYTADITDGAVTIDFNIIGQDQPKISGVEINVITLF